MRAHPIADIFPRMTTEDETRLAHDIATNGLREDIWLYEGQILDGRHRHAACIKVGVEPRFRTFEGTHDEAMSMSMGLNLARRHMTSEQRAALGVEIKAYQAKLAKERMSIAGQGQETIPDLQRGQARDIAADLVGSNGKYIDAAERIKDQAPDVYEKMGRGSYGSMAQAKKAARLNPDVRERVHAQMDQGATFKEALGEVFEEPESDINCTPVEWISVARELMGRIDLDPASNAYAQEIVQAGRYFTRDDDGLALEWSGCVWLNPPYSSGLIERFVERACKSWEAGELEAMLVLTNASLSARWWHRLAEVSDAIIVPAARMQFEQPHARQEKNNLYDQTLFAFGLGPGRVAQVVEPLGAKVMTQEIP